MKRLICVLLMALLCCSCAMAEVDEPEQVTADFLQKLLPGLMETPEETTLTFKSGAKENVFHPACFTVLDMDGNGVREIIVEVGQPEAFLILTWYENSVYMDEVPYRGMLNLKDDGTYAWSDGAADNGVASMKFVFATNRTTGEVNFAVTSNILAMMQTLEDDSIGWSVNKSDVDEETYRAYMVEQDAKLDALWYDFTAENLRLLLER